MPEKKKTMKQIHLSTRTPFFSHVPEARCDYPAFESMARSFKVALGREIKTIKWPASMPDLASKVADLFNVEVPDLLFLPGKRPGSLQAALGGNPGSRLKKSLSWTSLTHEINQPSIIQHRDTNC